MELLTAEEMRAIDRRAAEEFGLPVRLLMEQAGFQTARVAAEMLCGGRSYGGGIGPMLAGPGGSSPGGRVAVLTGRGNNGGDGLVAARYLHEWGFPIDVFLFGDPARLTDCAAANWRLAGGLGIGLRVVADRLPEDFGLRLRSAALIVDALLGTGVKGAVQGLPAEAIEAANLAGTPILAVDVPSGLDADRGGCAGPCIKAKVTVTFCRPKLGLALYPGASFAGEVRVADIGIPGEAVRRQNPAARLIVPEAVRSVLPRRPPDAHKGTFGHVLVLGGSAGYTGAPALAGLGALRAGAGLVTVAVPADVAGVVAGKLTEVMVRSLPAAQEGGLAEAAWPELAEELLAKADAVAAGPGLGRGSGTRALLLRLLERLDKPLVLDADGLNLLELESIAACRAPVVLTPHPGEAARLLGAAPDDVQADRPRAARELAARGRCIAVLKGARTLIARPDGALWVNPTGNSGMATGGTGDVLTGIIAGLLAQGAGPLEAALAGAYLHGKAGDLAAAGIGARALAAGDLLAFMGAAFRVTECRF